MLGDFGRKLRAYRKLKNMTQQELADHLQVSVSIIGGIERGNRLPTPALAKRIYEAVGLRYEPASESVDSKYKRGENRENWTG